MRLLLSQLRSPRGRLAARLMHSRISGIAARALRVAARAIAIRMAGGDTRAAMGGSAVRRMPKVLRSTGGQYSGGVPAVG